MGKDDNLEMFYNWWWTKVVCVTYLKYTELGGRLDTENKEESCQRLPHDFCTEIRNKTIYALLKDRA